MFVLYLLLCDTERQKYGWPVWVYMEPWDGDAEADESG